MSWDWKRRLYVPYFQYINPCGYTDKGVTSMQQESGHDIEIGNVREKLKEKFAEVFQVELHTA